MQKQQGQSMVEFALIAPIVFIMIFGMIYGGIMFVEYMHYSNAVRTAARQIAIIKNESLREKARSDQETKLRDLWEDEISIKLYKPDPKIKLVSNSVEVEEGGVKKTTVNSQDVVVNVTFKRVGTVPALLDALDFPPKTIKTLQYRMRVEVQPETTETSITED